MKITKLEAALMATALNRHKKYIEAGLKKFLENGNKEGYYERFNSRQKRNIVRNKEFKMKVIDETIAKLEALFSSTAEIDIILTEMDYDYTGLKCTELKSA